MIDVVNNDKTFFPVEIYKNPELNKHNSSRKTISEILKKKVEFDVVHKRTKMKLTERHIE